MAILMMLTVAFYAHKNKWGADVPFEWPRVLQGASASSPIVLGWPDRDLAARRRHRAA